MRRDAEALSDSSPFTAAVLSLRRSSELDTGLLPQALVAVRCALGHERAVENALAVEILDSGLERLPDRNVVARRPHARDHSVEVLVRSPLVLGHAQRH